VIDCDVHAVVPSISTLEPYLDDHWREVIATSQFGGPIDQAHPDGLPTSSRDDLIRVDGHPLGSTLASVQHHVLEGLNLSHAIIGCDYGVESVRNPDAAVALSRAVNDWQLAEWLEPEPRLRSAITVPSQQPALAASEIHRVGDHPAFVAVYLPVRSAVPYGNRMWWPVFQAAVEHDLVVELHFGGSPGTPPTSCGWPSFWTEEYVDMATAFQSQLTSLVAEGTFEAYPTLRVALMESGFAWLGPFLWRFDARWRGLRREVPWTRRAPSAYVRDHVRIALQPVDGPRDPTALRHVMDWCDSDDLLMFSSDFPHRHTTEGVDAVPPGLSAEIERKLLAENAGNWYRLS
jgi:predicted TIM-barrel fold metal-dependent hydrolase